MIVDLVSSMGDDLSIVNAARVSYGGYSDEWKDRDARLIKYLLKNKHTSPFEHVTFTFYVKVPIFIARQWMRHRTWSYNEVSYRYKQPEMEFFVPHKWRQQSNDNKQVTEGEIDAQAQRQATTYANAAYEHAKHTYQELLDLGVGRELARMVLPVGIYTEFYGTVNLHNLLKFIELRDHEHAQPEIAWCAKRLRELAEAAVPRTISIWEELRRTD